MFDVLVDELRTHSTEWLRRERERLLVEQRNLRTREMAVLRVLDERGQVDCSMGANGESAQTVRDKVETARALESLPAVSAVAFDGGFSDEQLTQVTRLADGDTDAEWARRAPNIDPQELARQASNLAKPTAEDSRARLRGAGAADLVEPRQNDVVAARASCPTRWARSSRPTITHLTEQMKRQGSSRGCRSTSAPRMRSWRCAHPIDGRRAHADPCAVGGHPSSGAAARSRGDRWHSDRRLVVGAAASQRVDRARARRRRRRRARDRTRDAGYLVQAAPRSHVRDTQCRIPGCARRRGLQVHHLIPRTWRGPDEISNLAAVCPAHHRLLIPHGLLALVGNPNLPDGLELVTASRGPP